MKNRSWFTLFFLLIMSSGALFAQQKAPRMEIALLLDTSSSMDGLIDQAKAKLWDVVNEMATARRNGQIPELFVALYHYGNDGLPASEGHIQQLVPLTRDLDKVSEELFALSTNGGNEFCGQVIQTAHKQLNWSKSNSDYKAIFIAGNEPFTQGGIDYQTACRAAIADGIVVNTIFCGNEQEGIDTFWKAGADLADGSFMVINQNQAIAAISAPQDAQILNLNGRLNQTYIAYGAAGAAAKQNQARQDANAASMNREVAVKRAVSKSSAMYKNASWDLVDAVTEGNVDLDEIEEEALPEPMQAMSPQEKKAYVAEQSEERKRIQTELQKLKKERAEYVAEQVKQDDTLDQAMVTAIRKQLKEKAFSFDENAAKDQKPTTNDQKDN